MLKTERLIAIVLLLQARSTITASKLSDILGVSVRTIYRDMDSLSLAHVPVSMAYGPGGGYFLSDDHRLDPSVFTDEEAVALALGGAIGDGAGLPEAQDALQRSLLKLEAALPDARRTNVRNARERILFDALAWYRHASPVDHLELLRSAVLHGLQIELLYRRSDGFGTQRRRVDPYGLVCKAGIWYLVAFCHMRKDFRTFRIDRIKDVEVQEEPVKRRPGFDLETYWEERRTYFEQVTTPFAVTLHVTDDVLWRIRRDVEVLQEGDDGSATVRVTLDSAQEAISYVLSLGTGAEIVDPPELRDSMVEVLRAIAARYK